MAHRPFRLIAAFAVAAMVSALSLPAEERVRLEGSAVAFERLAGLRSELFRRLPNLSIDWRHDGTGAAFVSLFDGSADIAVSSRPIEEREKTLASKLSLRLREYVLALDGVAIIVHPDNPIESLSTGQLRMLFAGRIVAWHGVGGSSLDLRLLSPPPSSGTFGFIEQAILEGAPIADSAEFAETEEAAAELVASDPRAVAAVSMSCDRSRVKTVAIRAGDSGPALLPTPESVAIEEYPLSREILLYVRGEPDEKIRRLLSFLLSSEGQTKVMEGGLVPLFADRPIPHALRSRDALGGAPVGRVLFRLRASRLDRAARRTLDGIAERSLEGTGEVWITGHSDLKEERLRAGRLSEERARAVESYLTGLGVKSFRVESRGAAEPIPALETPEKPGESESENRRADVWLLRRR